MSSGESRSWGISFELRADSFQVMIQTARSQSSTPEAGAPAEEAD